MRSIVIVDPTRVPRVALLKQEIFPAHESHESSRMDSLVAQCFSLSLSCFIPLKRVDWRQLLQTPHRMAGLALRAELGVATPTRRGGFASPSALHSVGRFQLR